jgi:HK97 family phage major capsid protein
MNRFLKIGTGLCLVLALVAIVAIIAQTSPGELLTAGSVLANAPAPLAADWQRELQAVNAAFETRDKELRALVEKGNSEVAATGKIAGETQAALQALVADGTKLQARLLDVEQKLGRRNAGGGAQAVDFDALFAEHKGLQQLKAGQSRSARIELTRHQLMHGDMHASITSLPSSAGDLIVPDRRPGILTPAERGFTVRNLVMPGRTASNAIEFVQETGFTNNADTVSEGVLKPESQLTFSMETRAVRTIAHWVKASKQILDDVPQLLSYVSGRLRYGLAYKEELQLLLGAGTGTDLDGLKTNATAYDTALTKAGDTKIDVIRHAITQVRVAEYAATGVVINPYDWDDIETEKDDNGRYIWANVNLSGEQRLWRLPVIDTMAMPRGEFLVGAFTPAAQIFDREDASVVVSSEDQDNLVKNMVTILVEERLVQAIYRPEAMVEGDYSQASGG